LIRNLFVSMGVFWGIVAVFAYVVSSFAHGSAPPGVLDSFLRVGRSYQRTQDFPSLDSLNGSYVSARCGNFENRCQLNRFCSPV
jgi:hypothetical protein